MSPNLLNGDYIILNNFKNKNFNKNQIVLTNLKFLFKNSKKKILGRCIGLPGEKIKIENGYIETGKKLLENINDIHENLIPNSIYDETLFPSDSNFKWNRDNYGPLIVPKKGMNIHLNTSNISLYKKVIEIYEENKILITNSKIIINDTVCSSYTFKNNYFWIMSDNRHNFFDSRNFGFVPSKNIENKIDLVLFNLKIKDRILKKLNNGEKNN
tara:strand:+ start:1094 stop:1732 length:639 start_codon:yes stop_codon:yes gene_type:complete